MIKVLPELRLHNIRRICQPHNNQMMEKINIFKAQTICNVDSPIKKKKRRQFKTGKLILLNWKKRKKKFSRGKIHRKTKMSKNSDWKKKRG